MSRKACCAWQHLYVRPSMECEQTQTSPGQYLAVAGLLRREGHIVERAQPTYPKRLGLAGTFRWMAVAADACDAVVSEDDHNAFQGRTLGHASAGRRVRPLVKDDQLSDWRERAESFFESYDVMLTPVTASPPLLAERWSERAWAANIRAERDSEWRVCRDVERRWLSGHDCPLWRTPYTRTPIGVQIAAPPGSEALLLGVAALVERLHPWERVAPGWA